MKALKFPALVAAAASVSAPANAEQYTITVRTDTDPSVTGFGASDKPGG